MIFCIFYAPLNFITGMNNNNIKLIIQNNSRNDYISMRNNTYTRKNNPKEYGNLVAFAPSDITKSTICSRSISKRVKSVVKRVRFPTMIIDKASDYIAFRNAFDYVTRGCLVISLFVRPPPPPPSHPMTPLLVTKNRFPLSSQLAETTYCLRRVLLATYYLLLTTTLTLYLASVVAVPPALALTRRAAAQGHL